MTLQQFTMALAAIQKSGVSFTLRELHLLAISPPAHATATRLSVRDLAAVLEINKPSVSRAVTMLVKEGLLTRADNETDRRQVVIHRTKAGESLMSVALRAAR